jgi:uncharacterized protein YbbC (DUF1343 family)
MLRRQFLQHATSAVVGMAASQVLAATAHRPAAPHPPPPAPAASQRPASRLRPTIQLGIDVLEASGFAPLKGHRVGLLTHPAGVNGNGVRTVDILRRAPGVRLVKLFGPEHGIHGDAPANAPVQNRTDRRTGLPVFSLYGKTRRPTPEMLKGLDVFVIDLQDIGSRSYTYVSCMRYAIEACFDAGVKVIVLDRPNPLGGLKVDGPGLDSKWMSYVGAYRVPYVHGLTIGELALAAARTPGWLKTAAFTNAAASVNTASAALPTAAAFAPVNSAKIEIVKMRGWRRSMRWRDTGLLWKATSPLMPNAEAAEGYPMTGLGCQLDDFSHGVKQRAGHNYLFRFIHFPGKDARDLERALRARKIRGLGVTPWRLRDGTEGVYLSITDWAALRLTEASFHMMQLSCQWAKKNPFAALSPGKRDLFNKHTGCEAFFNDLCKRGAATDIHAWTNRWEKEAHTFQDWSRRHWLYTV